MVSFKKKVHDHIWRVDIYSYILSTLSFLRSKDSRSDGLAATGSPTKGIVHNTKMPMTFKVIKFLTFNNYYYLSDVPFRDDLSSLSLFALRSWTQKSGTHFNNRAINYNFLFLFPPWRELLHPVSSQ